MPPNARETDERKRHHWFTAPKTEQPQTKFDKKRKMFYDQRQRLIAKAKKKTVAFPIRIRFHLGFVPTVRGHNWPMLDKNLQAANDVSWTFSREIQKTFKAETVVERSKTIRQNTMPFSEYLKTLVHTTAVILKKGRQPYPDSGPSAPFEQSTVVKHEV